MVVAVHGSQTQISVPKDGFNETTHHILLHGLSSIPLPNHVHTLSSQQKDMFTHLRYIPDESDLTQLYAIAGMTNKHE